MRAGKLPPELLRELLRDLPVDERVLVRPGVGRDAAAVEFGDRFLILTADPVSFTAERAGWYAVQISANDVACLGGEPRWFLATVLAPPDTEEAELRTLVADIGRACTEVGAVPVGGHTEISEAVTQLVVAGAMVGEATPERLVRGDAVREGDVIVQVGQIAIEGTALLAREAAPRLAAAGVARASVDAAAALLFDPGISVLSMARVLWELPGLHALHDPTEGGIATGCWELGEAAGLGAIMEKAALQVHPLTRELSAALGVDPIGLLASGALLASIDATDAAAAVTALQGAGFEARPIGRLGPRGGPGILVQEDGTEMPLPRFDQDEVVRVLSHGR